MFSIDHLFQLHGVVSNSVYFNARNFSKKGFLFLQKSKLFTFNQIEIFPFKKFQIRQICFSVVISAMWIFGFVLGVIFPIFLETFGLLTCLTTFGLFCFMNAIFCLYFVPETKGKSHEEIMELLRK